MVADALPLAVKYVPLVAGNRNMSFLPFCAKTEAEFLDWNIGKQRAAEVNKDVEFLIFNKKPVSRTS